MHDDSRGGNRLVRALRVANRRPRCALRGSLVSIYSHLQTMAMALLPFFFVFLFLSLGAPPACDGGSGGATSPHL